MVNLGNFFGARPVDPMSERQLAMACKAKGLVLDKATKQCRKPLPRGRKAAPASVVAPRGDSMTGAQMREMCKAQGKVLDKDTKQCRDPLPRGRKSSLEAAYRRGSVFFGARPTNPDSVRQKTLKCKEQGLVFDAVEDKCHESRRGGRVSSGPSVAQLRAACKAQGLVLDMDSKKCRESRRGAGLAEARTARAMKQALSGPTQKDMMAMCKAQGLVFDRDTKQCRARKVRGSTLEQAYKRGSLFFGVNRPAADQRAGIVYHSPASATKRPVYDILGPVKGPVTGAASFAVDSSVVTPAMQKSLGVMVPKVPAKKK